MQETIIILDPTPTPSYSVSPDHYVEWKQNLNMLKSWTN